MRNKLKKKISFIILAIVMMISLIRPVAAASGSFSVSVSSTKVTVGDKVKVTIKLTCNSGVCAEVYIDTSNSNLGSLSISNSSSYYTNGNFILIEPTSSSSVTITATLTAKKEGKCTVKVTVKDFIDWEGNSVSGGNGTKSKEIEIVKKTDNNTPTTTPLSGDASIASLAISGLELDREFASDNYEYVVYAPKGTDSITISAKASSSKAKIGKTTFAVKEGWNDLSVVCEAENGNKKTYKIRVYVEETPTIYFNNDSLGVVKNLDRLEPLEGFEAKTITINEEEVTIFNHGGINLIYLVDSEDNKDYYLFDVENKQVSERYNPVVIDNHSYLLTHVNYDLYEGMEEQFDRNKVNIGGQIVDGWTYKNSSLADYQIVCLMNGEGEKNLYSYDSREQTLQRYTLPQKEQTGNSNEELLTYLSYSSGAAGLLAFIASLFVAGKKRKTS